MSCSSVKAGFKFFQVKFILSRNIKLTIIFFKSSPVLRAFAMTIKEHGVEECEFVSPLNNQSFIV